MRERKVAKILKSKAERVEIRDFSEVWQEIEGRVDTAPQVEEIPVATKSKPRWFYPAVFSAVCAVIICACIPLLNHFLKPSEPQRYMADDLESVTVEKEVFFNEISQANINLPELASENITFYSICKTKDNKTVGGKFDYNILFNSTTYYLTVIFYKDNVDRAADEEVVFDQTYTSTVATAEYRVKDSIPEIPVYIYEIQANYKGVNYYMECTCPDGDLTPFLAQIFS